ncbi:hypothetical protein BDQ12DRAFT_680638, partial [Crucibulum laeve]
MSTSRYSDEHDSDEAKARLIDSDAHSTPFVDEPAYTLSSSRGRVLYTICACTIITAIYNLAASIVTRRQHVAFIPLTKLPRPDPFLGFLQD